MRILRDKKNAGVFDTITERLEAGDKASLFLSEYLPKEYRIYADVFLQYLSVADSLNLTSKIIELEKEQQRQLVKGVLYPCMLLCGSICGVFLFAVFVLPSMLSLMDSFHTDKTAYMHLGSVVTKIVWLLAVILVILAVVVLVAMSKKNLAKTYELCVRYFPDGLLVQSASRDFTCFYLECLRCGLSTNRILAILKQTTTKPLVAWIAVRMDTLLSEGDALEDAVYHAGIETVLAKFFRIAIYASDCEKMLEGYLAMFQIRTARQIRRFTNAVQIFSYAVIGSMLVFVYTILMIPMRMISQI